MFILALYASTFNGPEAVVNLSYYIATCRDTSIQMLLRGRALWTISANVKTFGFLDFEHRMTELVLNNIRERAPATEFFRFQLYRLASDLAIDSPHNLDKDKFAQNQLFVFRQGFNPTLFGLSPPLPNRPIRAPPTPQPFNV